MVVRVCLVALVGLSLLLGAVPVAEAQRKPPKPREKTGQLVITVTAPGADILIDGASVGTSPLAGPLTLAVGEHTLKVVKEGYAEYLDTVKIGTNETTTVEVDLLPFKAVLELRSTPPGVDVLVDGKLIGQTPMKYEVDAGEHVIRMGVDGYHDAEKSLRVEAGKRYEVDLTLVALPPPKKPPKKKEAAIYSKWWFWAGAGAVAVGATALVITVSSGGDPLDGADRVIDIEF